MPTVKFPIAIWEDYGGSFTARTISGEQPAATDSTEADAISQLKKFLQWFCREQNVSFEPELLEPEIEHYWVTTRPLYRTDEGEFPAEKTTSIRVACVIGRRRDKSLCCWLPTLGVQFFCKARNAVQNLVADYTRAVLNGMEPRAIARHLLPKSLRVDSINVKVKARLRVREHDLSSLKEVAEAMGDRVLQRSLTVAWGRDQEVGQLTERLETTRASLLLVGPSGVGKSAVLAGAVRKVERSSAKSTDTSDQVPQRQRRRFWLSSGSRIIAGMQYLGQWEERCEQVIEELSEIGGVLCVDSLLGLVQCGGDPRESVAAFFRPFIESGELRIVAESTAAELEACRRLLPGFDSLFQVVKIPEFDAPAARAVLVQLTTMLGQNLHIEIEPTAHDLAYRLYRRFMPYQTFPGRCAGFVRGLFDHAGANDVSKITVHHVMERFIDQTGLPERLLRDDVALGEADVLAQLTSRIYGQEAACGAAARLVTTFKSGLNDPGRPIGVHTFCGPTGVGKTELAKTLSDYLFGSGQSKDRMIRLDMSEYASYGAAEKLLTQPGGQPSELIKRVRSQPFVVVLFDEIEKAAPEVFDVLLGLIDEGRLTDRFGRTTTFCSAVIVMTSNLGADGANSIGFGNSGPASYENEVMSFFRPEFFNRLDEVVTFAPLSEETIRQITAKELEQIGQREGFERASLKLRWSPALEALMAERGFDGRYGARPLQRTLEQEVVAPIAHWIAKHAGMRNVTILVDIDDSKRVCVKPL